MCICKGAHADQTNSNTNDNVHIPSTSHYLYVKETAKIKLSKNISREANGEGECHTHNIDTAALS